MALPEWLEPMAATLTQERFAGPEWIFERKLDGIRLLAFKRGARRARSFRATACRSTDAYPAVAAPSPRCRCDDAILDGEATGVWGRQGRRRLPRLRRPLARRPQRHAAAARRTARAAGRRAVRAAAAPAWRCSTGDQPWERACREGWEGVIAKRRDSPYEHRRSQHWLKMKCEASQELVVGGFTDPQGAPRRPRRAAGRLLRRRRLRLRRQGRHRLRHRAAARRCAPGSIALERPGAAVHQGRSACRACARTGCGRDRRAGRPSSSGRRTASCAIRACSGCATDKTPREVVRERP